jgi:LAO/AO transport system kinase
MAALAPHTGQAHVIGLTGSPGVGKSTSTNALVAAFRRRGKRVGILAVDPSSPFSGGALLGDRWERRLRRAADEIEAIAVASLRARIGDLRAGHGVTEHAQAVVEGRIDPYAAAADVVAHLT